MKCSVKKFGGRAKVNVLFWISRFVERENTSEKIRSLIETRGKRGCSVDDDYSSSSASVLLCCRHCCCFFRFAAGHVIFFVVLLCEVCVSVFSKYVI